MDRRSPLPAGRFRALGPAVLVVLLLLAGLGALPDTGASHAVGAPLGPAPSAGAVLTFHETGLPAGTKWTVTTWPFDANGASLETTSSTLVTLPAAADTTTGAVDFSVWSVPGAGGNGTLWVPTEDPAPPVDASTEVVNVTFTNATLPPSSGPPPANSMVFTLHVLPEGLPAGLNWSASVNGTGYGTTGPAEEIPVVAGRNLSANAPGIYFPNGSAYVPTAFDLLPCDVGQFWQNHTSAPFLFQLRGAGVLLVHYTLEYRLLSLASVGGTVLPAPEWVAPMTSIELNATASAGYSFLGWSGLGPGAVNSSLPQITVNVTTGPVEELASFVPFRYTIQVHAFGLPTGQVFSVVYDGSPYASYNGTIVLPALPASVYALTVPDVLSNVSSVIRYVAANVTMTLPEVNESVVTLDANGSVTVTFAAEYGLVLTSTAGGTITPATGEYWEPPSGVVAIEAAPEAGWHFGGWRGAGPGSQSTLNLTVLLAVGGPVNESALFLPGPAVYDVVLTEVNLPAGVAWSAAVGPVGVAGTAASLTISNVPAGPSTVIVPSVSTAYAVRYADPDSTGLAIEVVGNTTVSVSFNPEYLVESVSTAGGTATPSSQWVANGTIVHFSAAPNAGDQFVGWEGSVPSAFATLNLTVTGPVNETAVFQVPPSLTPVPFPWYLDLAGLGAGAVAAFLIGTLVRRRSAPTA